MIKAPVTVIVRAVRQSGINFTLEETTQSGIDVYQDGCKGCQVSAFCELQNTFVGSVCTIALPPTVIPRQRSIFKTKNYYLPIAENYTTDQASNRNINCIKNGGPRNLCSSIPRS